MTKRGSHCIPRNRAQGTRADGRDSCQGTQQPAALGGTAQVVQTSNSMVLKCSVKQTHLCSGPVQPAATRLPAHPLGIWSLQSGDTVAPSGFITHIPSGNSVMATWPTLQNQDCAQKCLGHCAGAWGPLPSMYDDKMKSQPPQETCKDIFLAMSPIV